MIRTISMTAMLALTLLATRASADGKPSAVLYKNPQCTCCEAYADYMRQHGYTVAVRPTHDLSLIKRRHGVPADLAGCHTTLIDRYVVEGHVPVGTIDRLLAEQPRLRGISLPGMPTGSPGMNGPKTEPFKIYGFGEGKQRVYAVE